MWTIGFRSSSIIKLYTIKSFWLKNVFESQALFYGLGQTKWWCHYEHAFTYLWAIVLILVADFHIIISSQTVILMSKYKLFINWVSDVSSFIDEI